MASVNYWVILAAGVASFLFGAIWYGVLSKPWLAALDKSEEQLKASAGFAVPMAITIVAQLFMAWVLAGLLAHLLKGGVPANAQNGMLSAAFIWAGFIATTLSVNHAFQGTRRTLTLIDGGHWLAVLLIQGAIIGGWGLR
jgi:Protein of unknown function (DUF1761)